MGRSAALVLLALVLGAGAEGRDLHRFWDDRCADCHGHAATFARRALEPHGEILVGSHPAGDLRLFLANHGVPPQDVERVHAMLLAQARGEPAWEERCRRCHGRAADFVREALERRQGDLVGRTGGRPIAATLPGHARLSEADAASFKALLERIAGEIGLP